MGNGEERQGVSEELERECKEVGNKFNDVDNPVGVG